jgi:hypothetical protein
LGSIDALVVHGCNDMRALWSKELVGLTRVRVQEVIGASRVRNPYD